MVYISAFDRSGTIKIAIGKDKALKSIVMDSYEDFDEEKADAEDEIEQEDVDEEEKDQFFNLPNDFKESRKLFAVVSLEVARRLLSKLNLSDCELDWEKIRNLPRITRQIAFNLLNSIQYISEQVHSPPHEIEFCEQVLRYFIIGSRFKVLVRVVTQVVRIVSQLSKLNKVQKLNLAMCTSVNDVLKDLQAGFENWLSYGNFESSPHTLNLQYEKLVVFHSQLHIRDT